MGCASYFCQNWVWFMELELENYWANNFTHKYSLGMVFKHRGHHHLRTLPGRKSRCTSKIVGMVKNCQMFGNFHGDPKIEATPKTHLQTAKLPYLLVKTMISCSKPFHFLGPDNTRWGVLPHRRRDTPHRCCLGDKKMSTKDTAEASQGVSTKKRKNYLGTYLYVRVYIYI